MQLTEKVWIVDDEGYVLQVLLETLVQQGWSLPFFRTQLEADTEAQARFTAAVAEHTLEMSVAQDKLDALIERQAELEAA